MGRWCERQVNLSGEAAGNPVDAIPIVRGAVPAATIALIAAGVVVFAAAVLLAVHAVRLSRSVAAAAARLGVTPAGGRDPRALSGALDRLEAAAEAERQERARLEGALGAAGIGVLVTDGRGEVVFANQAAVPYLSGRPGEAVVEGRVSEAITAALSEDEVLTRELELYTPRRRVVRLEVVPLRDEGGKRLGAVAYVADVTEERRVEAMRRDFVANVGHELKTPLGALVVLAETLSTHAGDAAIAARLAERMQTEAHRLSRLLEDMLDLSAAEGGTAHAGPASVAAVVAEVADQAGVEAARRGVSLVVGEVPAEAVVPGDERQLRTMLMNLVDNAVKYSDPEPGRPPPRVWVRVRAEGEWVVVEVQDEGIGIPEGHLGRIFERFYRVDRARSRATGGTGLGLSIVRHVALNHGGEVGVESRLGEGSLFWVRLPRWREP
jgi:signal transduction histidine kinase